MMHPQSQPLFDAQATLGFVIKQASHIEPGVYATRYPDIQYRDIVPVDTSASEFAQSVTYFSSDKYGQAEFINGNADDIPLAGTTRAKHETGVHTAAIGYGFGWEEVGVAQMMGQNLQADDAMAARRAAEELVDRVVLNGDTGKNFGGLIDNSKVTPNAAGFGDWGTLSVAGTATPQKMVDDMNNAIANIFNTTNTVAIGDTLLLPWTKWQKIAATRMSTQSDMTVLQYFMQNNLYTMMTGRPLNIRGLRGLDTAGVSGVPRMIAYRNDPQVLKFHMPMPHRFLPVFQKDPLNWVVPGVMRLGGLDIRLPKEVVYVDGI